MADPVYLSITELPGTGAAAPTVVDFNFAGGYINRTHIKAYILDTTTFARTAVPVLAEHFVTDWRLQLPVSVPVGSVLRVYRDTPKDAPLVDFTNGARINEGNLDLVAQQATFVAAEAADQLAAFGGTAEALEAAAAAAASAAAATAAVATAAASAETAAEEAVIAADFAGAAAESAAEAASAVDGLSAALSAPTGAAMVGFIPPGTGAVARTVQDKGEESVSVLDFMTSAQKNDVVSGAGLIDVTAAINAASATGESLEWPDGVYRIEGTITGGSGGWYGRGQGNSAYGSTWDGSGTFLKLIGSNGGAAHIKPPRDFQGFHIDGVDKTPLAVDLGENGSFTAFQRWKRITVRNCADALRQFNFYSTTLEDVVIQGNVRGVTITPTDGPGDDGYFTATSWKNVHIADNDVYGLNAAPPLVSGTWQWDNVVIERNGTTGGTYQARLKNISVTGRAVYLEGSPTVPALKLETATITGDEWFVNGTGGIDASNQQCTVDVRRIRMATATDVLTNFPSDARLIFRDSDIRTDVRGWAGVVCLESVNISGVTEQQNFRPRVLAIGQSPGAAYQPTEFRMGLSGKKTFSGTINAGQSAQVIGDQYFPGIMADGAGFGSVQAYQPGLLVQITPGTTGSTDYYCVRLVNTTASNITLTNVQVNWTILRAIPQAL